MSGVDEFISYSHTAAGVQAGDTLAGYQCNHVRESVYTFPMETRHPLSSGRSLVEGLKRAFSGQH